MKRKYDEFVDLHVAVVPQKHWNQQLNHANQKVLATKVSAGFIRVSRESTIHSLRKEISKQIGLEKLYPDYVFLRNVADCLVLVHRKQEDILKSAEFAPPTIEYPELLILPVGEPQQSVSSHAYSNRSSVQRSNDSPRTSVNISIANESATGSVTVTENDVHKDTSRNSSGNEPQRLPYLPSTRLHRPRQKVTSGNKAGLTNGLLEKLDPDGQSSVRTIVRSGSSHIVQDGAGRDSPHSSLTRRSPGKDSTVSVNSKSPAARSNGTAVTNPSVPKYDDAIVTDAYLPDLRDRQGSGSSSIRDDFTRKWKHSQSAQSQSPQNNASNHESPHSNTVAYFIKSTVNKNNETPTQVSPFLASSHSKYSVHSDERHERNDEDYHRLNSETAGRDTRFSGSQDFGRVSTGRRTNQSDRIGSVNSSYEERFPNEFCKQGSITNIHPSTQSVTDGGKPVNSRIEITTPATGTDSNIIPRPLIIRKSEKVNAVKYESHDPKSDNSEDGDATTIRDTSNPSRESLRSALSRYSVSNLPDSSNTVAITFQQHSADLRKRYQQRDSRMIPRSNTESNDSNLSPTRVLSEESQRYSDDIPDHQNPPPPTNEPTRSVTENRQSQLFGEKQNRQWTITGQSPSQYDDSKIRQGYEEHRNSPMRVPSSSDRSTSFPVHSRHNERGNIHDSHPQVKSPSPYFKHSPARMPIQSPDLRSTEVTKSPTPNERHEMISNFIIKENISTSIPKVGLQPISRGTPDGTHVSRRPGASSETRRENIPSSIGSDDEEPSNIAAYSYVDPRGGYVVSEDKSDLLSPFQNGKTTTSQPSNDQSEIISLPSQGHESVLSDYEETQHAKAKFRDESQTHRELDEDSHLRRALWQDLRKIRERRERLEEIRQVTIKEARLKAAMISRKRDGSQDVWKRRHHEEKKVTDSLTKFYQALESQCNNLNQKTTVDNVPNVNRKRNTMRTTYTDQRPSFKKNSELQAKRIITQINEMKSRLAEVKAKLAAEIKMRHDVEQELKTMRKGLLSKKIQSNLAFRRINHYEELVRAPKGIPRRRFRKY